MQDTRCGLRWFDIVVYITADAGSGNTVSELPMTDGFSNAEIRIYIAM